MRIAYYVPNASFVQDGVGGDRTMAQGLMSGLRGRGHDVELVTRLGSGGALPLRRLLAEAVAVRRRVRRLRPDAWLVYSPSAEEPDLFGWWQRPGGYVLFGAHAAGRAPLLREPQALLRWAAHRAALARATHVVAWRPASEDKLRQAGLRAPKLRVLLPAVRPWPELPSRQEARARLGLPADVPVVLCATRFSASRPGKPKYKKTDMALELITLVERLPPEVVLLLVGDEGAGLARLRARAAELEPGRVRVDVSLDHDAMRWYFAACDVYAYPHPKDTPWMSVLEAQLCGRAVVALRTRSAELVVQHGRGGLLAGDLDEFGRHLAELCADRARCDRMGAEGAAFVTAHHALDVRLRELEELLASRPAGAERTWRHAPGRSGRGPLCTGGTTPHHRTG